MTLIEREHASTHLRTLFRECLDRQGRVAAISGHVGSGKTALLHSFAQQAVDSGALFLSAAGSSAERNLPLGVMVQLFQNLPLPPQEAELVMRLLNDSELAARAGAPESAVSEEAMYELFGLCGILLGLAEKEVILIGIDDVHFADVASLRCLLHLVRRLRTTPIMMVLGECAYHPAANPFFGAELLRQPHFQRMHMTPLSYAGVTRLLEEEIGPDAARELAAPCHTVSRGNPLLLRALIDDFRASVPPPDSNSRSFGKSSAVPGAVNSPGDIVFGDVFVQSVTASLSSYSTSLLSIARAIAVVGESVPPTVVGELLNLDRETVVQAIETLTRTELLVDGRFRHEAIHKAVLDGVTPANRAYMNERAARVLHNLGAPARTLAGHLVAAGSIREPWVSPTLREAAVQALAEGETQQAIGHLRLAARHCADDRELAAVQAALIQAEWRVDPSKAIRRIPELTSAARHGHLEEQHITRPVNYLLWHGQAQEAVEILDLADHPRDLKAPPSAQAVAENEATRLWMRYAYPELLGVLIDVTPLTGDQSLASATSPRLKAPLVLADVLTNGPTRESLDAAQEILRTEQLSDATLTSITTMLVALVLADRPDRAAYWCDPLLKEADDPRSPTWGALFFAIRALIDLRRGASHGPRSTRRPLSR